MSRFYVPSDCIKGDTISISGNEAHHILNVMRLKFGDEVLVFDGTGNEYTGTVKEAGRKSLSLKIISKRRVQNETSHRITLMQAIPKKEKMDYIVEKATELGVTRIVPIVSARTIPDWNEAKKKNIAERWKKISASAAKQCGRADLVDIASITPLEKAVAGQYNLKLMAALTDNAIDLKNALKSSASGNIAIAIGPEGDFTPEEIEAAEKQGFKIVNLGPRVLKSDTAGLAVLAMINYEYDNR